MKTQKNAAFLGIFTALALLGLVFAACGDPPGSDTTVAVSGVTLDIPSKTLPVGEGFTLTATVEPSNATNQALIWSSSDDTIASVVNGVVTAESPGDATITVTTADGGFEAECAVTVIPMPTSIEITTAPTKDLYKVGEELDLDGLVVSASYEGDYADDEIDIELLEISGFNSTTAGDKPITVTYIYDNDLSDTFTVTVLALTKIEVTKSPDIVTVGEELDFDEIEVEATWGDDSTEKYIKETVEITIADISGHEKERAAEQTLTVTFTHGGVTKTADFTVLVLGVDEITIDTEPTKTLYKTGEALDLDGLVVKATYSNGEEGEVEHSALNISGFDSATAGDKTVTVTYGGESDTFTVTVIAVTKIVIDTEPTKTLYKTGETLDLTGLVVEATWGDDSTDKYITEAVTITAANITGFSSATAGTKTLTVSYGGKSTTFTVMVFQQLPAPSNLQTGGGTLTWSAVNNASSYTVDIGGTEYTTTTNSYSLSSLTTPATYTIKVKAIGNGTTYTDSEWSTINYIIKGPTPGLLFTLINNNTAYSVARGTATGTEIVIPPVYNNLPVTTIANGGFKYSAMTNIIIPNSVTSIGSEAFYSCSGLISVTIPDSVTSIGEYAFYICYNLTRVNIPIGVTIINTRTFQGCDNLTSIVIPDSVTSIGSEAFSGCPFTSIIIPNNVTSIAQYAFSACSRLTSIVIPVSVTSIGNNAFNYCNNLTRVFYGGANNAAWSGIIIGTNNTPLSNATLYYYSATNPGTSNTHWRYVDGIPMVWGAAAQQLDAPSNLEINGATLTWSYVNNASGYTLDINGTEYTATTNSYSLSGLITSGTYTIKVKAKGNWATYTDSDWSLSVQYMVAAQQLAAPQNLQTQTIGATLTWSVVNNASGYTVDIDGTEYTAGANSYSLSGLTTSGTYTIKVKAKGNGAPYTDSDWSQTVQYAVVAVSVTFNPNGGNWNGSTANKTVTAANTITKPDDPVKGGYISCLDGWYKEEGLINKWDFENETVTTDITLYAKWRAYEIGDRGPGGGTIFYRNTTGFTMTDDNSTAYYLEAAYAGGTSSREWASSAFISTNIAGLATGIGTGRKNTALILATNANAPAALYCRNNNYNTVKTDWFLPSREELVQFSNYKIGVAEKISSLPNYSVWSSSQYDGTRAVALLYSPTVNGSPTNVDKNISHYVWPIRAF